MEKVQNKSFKKFLIVWMGQFISTIGTGMTAFSLGVYVFNQTHLATSVALVTLFTFMPDILLRPFGGILADRFDRRLMMIIGDLGAALGLVFILVVMLNGDIVLWQIYLGVTISAVFTALRSPAYKASITDLLSEDEYSKGSGMNQLAESSKFLLSPIISGFLLSMTNIETVLVFDILTFVIAIGAVFVIKKGLQDTAEDQMQQHWLKDLSEGWQTIVKNRGVFALVMLISLLTFYIGFANTLVTPMVLVFTDEKALGTMMSTAAMGMFFSSIIIGMMMIKKYVKIMVIGLIVMGLAFALTGITTNVYFITGALFLVFVTLPFVNMGADVLVRKNIPNKMQGRAWGIIGVLSQIGFIAAYASAGLLADKVFNPLLVEGGPLASTVGQYIGVGEGRGIAFLFIVAGVLIIPLGIILSQVKSIKALEVVKD